MVEWESGGSQDVWLYKGYTRDPCGDRAALYLECVNVNQCSGGDIAQYSSTVYYTYHFTKILEYNVTIRTLTSIQCRTVAQ